MSLTEKPLVVGLAGFGVVGGGLCQLLRENADLTKKRAGREIKIKTILVRDAARERGVPAPEGARLTTNAEELGKDPEIDAIVELMGGIEAPERLIRMALENGKDIVTANKALLAEKGLAIFELAAKRKSIVRYEASVAGAVPVIASLKESLAGNRVKSIIGILNGTSNYILSEMSSNGLEFDIALRQAQEMGYAEADPSLDIDGMDAAHKLTILIRLAFGVDYPLASLSVQGIRGMSAMDIRLAREFGYRIKLIGHARALKKGDGGFTLAAGVFPALAPHNFLLARVGGSYNALRLQANASGPLFFHGKGAGALPTAGAVLADLIAVARGERPNNAGYADPDLPHADILPPDDWRSCYYTRVMVADTPGVLRDISGCMAAEDISVAQMIQKKEMAASGVPLVFMTHETSHKAIKRALERAARASLLREPPVFLRVLESGSEPDS